MKKSTSKLARTAASNFQDKLSQPMREATVASAKATAKELARAWATASPRSDPAPSRTPKSARSHRTETRLICLTSMISSLRATSTLTMTSVTAATLSTGLMLARAIHMSPFKPSLKSPGGELLTSRATTLSSAITELSIPRISTKVSSATVGSWLLPLVYLKFQAVSRIPS